MKGITYPNAHDHAMKIHAQLAANKTRCGRQIKNAQEDLGPVNCGLCLKSLWRQLRSARRKLNGPRFKRGHMRLPIE